MRYKFPWVGIDLVNCNLIGTSPSDLGVYYIQVLASSNGNARAFTIYVSNFTVEVPDQTEGSLGVTVMAVAPDNGANVTVTVDPEQGKFSGGQNVISIEGNSDTISM